MTEKHETSRRTAKAEPVDTVNDSGIAAKASPKDIDAAVRDGDQDRVAMASRRPDGSPAQTEGFTYVDTDAAREATETQLTEQAVSNADQVVRVPAEVPTDAEEGRNDMDPAVSAIADAHDQAAKAAQSRVEGEFGKRS